MRFLEAHRKIPSPSPALPHPTFRLPAVHAQQPRRRLPDARALAGAGDRLRVVEQIKAGLDVILGSDYASFLAAFIRPLLQVRPAIVSCVPPRTSAVALSQR